MLNEHYFSRRLLPIFCLRGWASANVSFEVTPVGSPEKVGWLEWVDGGQSLSRSGRPLAEIEVKKKKRVPTYVSK